MKITLREKTILIIFGLFLTLAILETGLRLGGFIILSLQERRNQLSIRQRGEYRIICFGESTTQGQYPHYLEEILNQRKIGIKFSVIDKGRASIITSYIVDHLEESLEEIKPDMVITMIGINDFASHMPFEYSIPNKHPLFFQSLRIYKLVRLLCLHIKARAKEYVKANKTAQITRFTGLYAKPKGVYTKEDSFRKPGDLSKKDITQSPGRVTELIELGYKYISYARNIEAEKAFQTAIALDPKNYEAHLGLAWAYNRQIRNEESNSTYQKAINLCPSNPKGYQELGRCYCDFKEYKKAEDLFRKAVDLSPQDPVSKLYLGWAYKMQGKDEQAHRQFKKVIELFQIQKSDDQIDREYGMLATLYTEIGEYELADKYYKKANGSRNKQYNPLTRSNYQKIKDILKRRGVKLVCVQYPMRNIEPLKRIFQGQEGVIFVDNEKVFKEAVSKDGYKEYFVDMFGGDFGHCTRKGNKLLAENIANKILKEIFGK